MRTKNTLPPVDKTGQDALRQRYGKQKKFLAGFELPALLALSGFPELQDVEIEFVAQKSNTPMATRPTKTSIFRTAEKRKYSVYITEKIKKGREDVLPRNLPLDMQVGLIAHELCHVCDFLRKNSFQSIGTGMLYGFKSYKKKLERRVDTMTVLRGFGPKLLQFAEWMEQRQTQPEHRSDTYFQTYFDFYLTPVQIRKLMMEYESKNSG